MPNEAFESKYQQLGHLGSGANGVVVKCVRRDDPKAEHFAAKMTRRGFNDSILPELEVGKYLNHPKITKVVESFSGSLNESTVMVMNILPGGTLH